MKSQFDQDLERAGFSGDTIKAASFEIMEEYAKHLAAKVIEEAGAGNKEFTVSSEDITEYFRPRMKEKFPTMPDELFEKVLLVLVAAAGHFLGLALRDALKNSPVNVQVKKEARFAGGADFNKEMEAEGLDPQKVLDQLLKIAREFAATVAARVISQASESTEERGVLEMGEDEQEAFFRNSARKMFPTMNEALKKKVAEAAVFAFNQQPVTFINEFLPPDLRLEKVEFGEKK